MKERIFIHCHLFIFILFAIRRQLSGHSDRATADNDRTKPNVTECRPAARVGTCVPALSLQRVAGFDSPSSHKLFSTQHSSFLSTPIVRPATRVKTYYVDEKTDDDDDDDDDDTV